MYAACSCAWSSTSTAAQLVVVHHAASLAGDTPMVAASCACVTLPNAWARQARSAEVGVGHTYGARAVAPATTSAASSDASTQRAMSAGRVCRAIAVAVAAGAAVHVQVALLGVVQVPLLSCAGHAGQSPPRHGACVVAQQLVVEARATAHRLSVPGCACARV